MNLLMQIHAAAESAALTIAARDKDGSFLEETLRSGMASALPGESRREKSLELSRWSETLGGVDLLWRPPGTNVTVAIETKVSDVSDCLFDVLKLASGIAERRIDLGVIVVAATRTAWSKAGAMASLTSALPVGATALRWSTRELLRAEEPRWTRTWGRSGARPMALPRGFATQGAAPIEMPLAADHELRLVYVLTASDVWVAVEADGQAGRDQIEHAYLDADDHRVEGAFEAETMARLEARLEARRGEDERAIDPSTLSPASAIFYGDDPPAVKIQRLRDEIGQTEEAMGYGSSLLRQYPELLDGPV